MSACKNCFLNTRNFFYCVSSFVNKSSTKLNQTQTLQLLHQITNDFIEAFKKADVVVTPTAPSVAFPLGALLDNPVEMYLQDIFTVTINLCGVPAVSMPAGKVDGLPVGVQIIGRHFDEATILKAAGKLEGGRE